MVFPFLSPTIIEIDNNVRGGFLMDVPSGTVWLFICEDAWCSVDRFGGGVEGSLAIYGACAWGAYSY